MSDGEAGSIVIPQLKLAVRQHPDFGGSTCETQRHGAEWCLMPHDPHLGFTRPAAVSGDVLCHHGRLRGATPIRAAAPLFDSLAA